MPRGGKRTGAGRRKGESAPLSAALLTKGDNGKAFADRVLARLKTAPDLKKINTAEDYALSLLFSRDIQTRSFNFNRLLDRKFGKSVQAVAISNADGEKFEVNMTSSRDKLWAKLCPDSGAPPWRRKSGPGPEEDGASPPDDGSVAEAAATPTDDTHRDP
jgi:hypothetical protein